MQLPLPMTRPLALATLGIGLVLVAIAIWAYGTDIAGAICADGWVSTSGNRGRCSSHGGVEEDKIVDTFIGQKPVSWIGVTKWPALILGCIGAITGLIGVTATSAIAFSPAKLKFGSGGNVEPTIRVHLFAGSSLELLVKVKEKPQGYAIEVTSSTGEVSQILRSQPLPQDRGLAELRLLTTEADKRRFGSRQTKAVQAFGTNLFDSIFTDSTERAFRDSIDFVRQHNAALRIVLQLDKPFADIPWEYVYDKDRGSFLARSQETSLVRRLPTSHGTRTQSRISQLRILSMTASPRQTNPLDVASERQRIQDALGPSIEAGDVELSFVPGATLDSLRTALRSFQPHVFHFAGHGDWHDERDDGVILFEDTAGFPEPCTGIDLGSILNQSGLRLAVFNSCHGATPSKEDRFAGVTNSLVAQGVPAAIGMQFAFDDKAAVIFAQVLMSELGSGASLDRAVSNARIAVFTQRKDIAWGTPVITTRIPLDDVLPRD